MATCNNRYLQSGYYSDDNYYDNDCVENEYIGINCSSTMTSVVLAAATVSAMSNSNILCHALIAKHVVIKAVSTALALPASLAIVNINTVSSIDSSAVNISDNLDLFMALSKLAERCRQTNVKVATIDKLSKDYLIASDIKPLYSGKEIINV